MHKFALVAALAFAACDSPNTTSGVGCEVAYRAACHSAFAGHCQEPMTFATTTGEQTIESEAECVDALVDGTGIAEEGGLEPDDGARYGCAYAPPGRSFADCVRVMDERTCAEPASIEDVSAWSFDLYRWCNAAFDPQAN